MNDSKWADGGPVELTGWPALHRWLACKLGEHGRTSEEWETTEVSPRVQRHTVTAWCGDCGRPLRNAERAKCRECGQPVSRRQAPRGVEWTVKS